MNVIAVTQSRSKEMFDRVESGGRWLGPTVRLVYVCHLFRFRGGGAKDLNWTTPTC